MPVLTSGDTIAVTIEGRLFNQQILLTQHYTAVLVTGPGDPVQDVLFALHTRLDAAGKLYQAYALCLSSEMVGLRCKLQDIWPIRYSYIEEEPTVVTGGVLEDSMPPNVSQTITLAGITAGRGFTGTKHISAVPLSFTENGMPTIGSVGPMSALANELRASVAVVTTFASTYDFNPILYKRAAPLDSEPVVTWRLGSTTRVERRRTVGLGS